MFFDNLVQFTQQHPWVIWLAAYSVLIFALIWAAYYFGGHKWVDFVVYSVGLPLFLTFWVLEKVIQAIRWPWGYRNRRLLQETFQVSEYNYKTDEKVNRMLSCYARDLNNACNMQEGLQKDPASSLSQRERADELVRVTKSVFWLAHKVARKNGFPVKSSFKSYLTV